MVDYAGQTANTKANQRLLEFSRNRAAAATSNAIAQPGAPGILRGRFV